MKFGAKPSELKPFYNVASSDIQHKLNPTVIHPLVSTNYTRIYQYSMVSPLPVSNSTARNKVQCSAAHFVTNDFSYYSSVTSMLDQLQWPRLEQRRCFSKLIMFYKILHGNLILQHLRTRGHSHHSATPWPFSRTDTYLNSFPPSAIKLWNSLPNHLTDFEGISQFKDELFLHLFP